MSELYDIEYCPSCGTAGEEVTTAQCRLPQEEQYVCPKCDAIWGRFASVPDAKLPAMRYYHSGEEVRQLTEMLKAQESSLGD